jgi:pilus assembly protein CpaF
MGGELERASPGEEGAAPPDLARRGATGRRIIAKALAAEAAALAAGRRPDAEAERRAGHVTFNALSGLDGFHPYLDDARAESVNANGCDQVFVQYVGRVAPGVRRLPPATPG